MQSSHEVRRTSIVDSVCIPASRCAVFEYSQQRSIDDFDIPFFATPPLLIPPVSRAIPWAAGHFNGPMHSREGNPGWRSIFYLYSSVKSRSPEPQRHGLGKIAFG